MEPQAPAMTNDHRLAEVYKHTVLLYSVIHSMIHAMPIDKISAKDCHYSVLHHLKKLFIAKNKSALALLPRTVFKCYFHDQ